MSTENPSAKSRPPWLPLVIGAAILAGALALSTQPEETADGVKILRSVRERDSAMSRAQTLSAAQLKAVDKNVKLSATDLESLRKAQKEVEAVILFEPKATAPYLVAGRIAEALEDPLRAEERYRQACANVDQDSDPEQRKLNYLDGAEAGFRLCSILVARNQMSEAKPFADDIVRIVPNAPHYHVVRAQIVFQLGDKKEALKELSTALTLDPENDLARSLRAFMSKK